MTIRFSVTDTACALKLQCTRLAPLLLTPRRRKEHEALAAAGAREAEEGFAVEHRRRAGIEGTILGGVRALHLRQARRSPVHVVSAFIRIIATPPVA